MSTATTVARCAGCGAELPDPEALVTDMLASLRAALPDTAHGVARDDHIYYQELRCDLCWRAMLAAEAAHHSTNFSEQEDPLAPWLRALVRVSQQA